MAEVGSRRDHDENLLIFIESIRANTQVVGQLFLGLSTERITAELTKQRSSLAKQESIVILTIVAIGFLAISYLIIRPVTAISRIMSQTHSAVGKYEESGQAATSETRHCDGLFQSLPTQLRDEIGDLARAFVRLQSRTSHAMGDLRKSERKHRALVEAMPDMMFRLSRDGVFLDGKIPKSLSAAVQPEGLIGKYAHEILPDEAFKTLLKHLHLALDTGEVQLFITCRKSEARRSTSKRVSWSAAMTRPC